MKSFSRMFVFALLMGMFGTLACAADAPKVEDKAASDKAAMMEKMIVDYNGQKKFTENASHEIQTPLAVIKSKIDLRSKA